MASVVFVPMGQPSHHTQNLCPECAPVDSPLYTVQNDSDARHCYSCGYRRPAPREGAARVLVIGRSGRAVGQVGERLSRVLRTLEVGAIIAVGVDFPITRRWARDLKVNVGWHRPEPGWATHAVVLPGGVTPDALATDIDKTILASDGQQIWI